MKEKFSISITSPCQEDFKNFQPTEKGGFCAACKKEVIDFTNMSSKEILNYFKQNNSNKTCGKFKNNQLEVLYSQPPQLKKNTFFHGLAMMLLSLFIPQQIMAQKNTPKIELRKNHEQPIKISQPESFKIKGTIKDETGVLPGVTILLKGTTVGAETDFDGNFKFPQPLKEGDVLIFNFIGLKTEEIVITRKNKTINLVMENDAILGEVILTGEVAIKRTFTKKKSIK
ncbi:CarboxypepD_reg-like domain-containing protein [Tenacibaculum sp. MAR_2009_124]|uniref:carboxypeptidase-like regulatory domain-containing protein n=1 Tax=Tenacibaculum sp. MAR_2009_124 TaxID=1250059 RepID=UPI000897E82D|nr:carboxypeptidase-like regulatory domain-containing protein [Tenacibaculum sp. MAR_2009_124]SEB44818.1 CarboxypepD_reg-like domain-containing protein [Tenacibaculum sp. MAR_2009_124]